MGPDVQLCLMSDDLTAPPPPLLLGALPPEAVAVALERLADLMARAARASREGDDE